MDHSPAQSASPPVETGARSINMKFTSVTSPLRNADLKILVAKANSVPSWWPMSDLSRSAYHQNIKKNTRVKIFWGGTCGLSHQPDRRTGDKAREDDGGNTRWHLCWALKRKGFAIRKGLIWSSRLKLECSASPSFWLARRHLAFCKPEHFQLFF